MKFRFWRRRPKPVHHFPVWFSCPDCGCWVDAMNTPALTAHGEMHAAELLRRIDDGDYGDGQVRYYR